ncbi:hypothetical protein J6590_030420 [Homalodisca vitripennis]|nr:hypothetical protein J6590_030420 [Homalodisca vitripennis]
MVGAVNCCSANSFLLPNLESNTVLEKAGGVVARTSSIPELTIPSDHRRVFYCLQKQIQHRDNGGFVARTNSSPGLTIPKTTTVLEEVVAGGVVARTSSSPELTIPSDHRRVFHCPQKQTQYLRRRWLEVLWPGQAPARS